MNSFSLFEYKYIYFDGKGSYGYDQSRNLCVTEKIFNEIDRFVRKNDQQTQFLNPTYKIGFGNVLQAQNYVGVIQTKDGTTIEILPKIGASGVPASEARNILVKMLRSLKKSPFKHFNTSNLNLEKIPLLEIFITMFLEEITLLVRKGIKNDYIEKEDNLRFLKGKLKMNEQIKRNYLHKERFYVEYEEFVSDRIENRIIKTTLNYLYKVSKSNRNQQRIREFLFVFDGVDEIDKRAVKNSFSKIMINRQMKDYEKILPWCKAFLLGKSFTPYKGNDIAFALLYDMNLLFESYVGRYIKQKYIGLDVRLQDRRHCLSVEPRKYELRPDIVIDIVIKNATTTIVADTKWKILGGQNNYKVSQADLYQLYVYGKKYHCQQLYLIYPYIDQNTLSDEYWFHQDEDQELNLKILFFDIQMEEFENNGQLLPNVIVP